MPAHETESISNPSEKMGYANDTSDIAHTSSKSEEDNNNGEVFQNADYRALGWFVSPCPTRSKSRETRTDMSGTPQDPHHSHPHEAMLRHRRPSHPLGL